MRVPFFSPGRVHLGKIRLLEYPMSDQEYIKQTLKEADVYRTQGLLADAKKKYLEVLKVVGNNEKLMKHQKLIDAINSKIRAVDKAFAEFKEAPPTPELSPDLLRLIKKLFTFSQTKEAAAIEGAVALAKFGQYEQALIEFQKLLEEGILPVVTAKNIIRCYIALKAPNGAIAQFEKWRARNLVSDQDLKYVRSFLISSLEKEGIKANIPEVEKTRRPVKPAKKEEVFLEISAITVGFDGGSLKGQNVDFDVHFQSANTVSVVISAGQKNLADAFQPGTRLSSIQCYSPITVFRTSGTVTGKDRIKQGPRQGDFTVDITIDTD
jgi:tetratricopeptide (TPR) repeat protein